MTPAVCFDDDVQMWVVADPDAVRQVLLDPQTFRPDNALTAFTPIGVDGLRTLATVGFALPPTLANNASDTHRAIRQTVARYFSAGRVASAEVLTRSLNEARFTAVAEQLRGGGSVELVAGAISDVPAVVLLDLLGLEELDVRRLKRWSIDSLELFWGRPTQQRQEQLTQSAAEFYAWLRTLAETARCGTGAPFFTDLALLGLSDEEICAIGYFLLIAGQETTAQLVTTVFWRALRNRATWNAIAGDSAQAVECVEQSLAEDSSVPTWRRITSRTTTVGGVAFPAGAPVLLRLTGTGGSAELAFGLGIHRCLGARLARMEATVALEVGSRLLPALTLCEEQPPMIDLLSFLAPSRLLVTQSIEVGCRYAAPSLSQSN